MMMRNRIENENRIDDENLAQYFFFFRNPRAKQKLKKIQPFRAAPDKTSL